MADYPRRPAARLGTALAIVAAVAASPIHQSVAAAPRAPANLVGEWADDAGERFLYWAQRAGLHKGLIDALQGSLLRDGFIVNLPWRDMTGDHRDDVLALEFDFGPGGLGLTDTTTRFEALDGRSGKTLWRREFESNFVLPVEIALGPKARNGVLALLHDFETDTITFLAIDRTGRDFYEQSFTAKNQLGAGVVTGREGVLSFDLQDSLRGRATEVLIGIADVRQSYVTDPALPSVVGRTRTVLIDGKTGELVAHPDEEIGVGRVPTPLAAPDLDGDGLDDHVVTYVLPDVERDEEAGLPVVPDHEAEYVRGRRGTDGAKLWTSDPLELGEGWDGPAIKADLGLGDQTRDGRDEILLSYDGLGALRPDMQFVYPRPELRGAWSLSGKDGSLLWHRPVTAAVVVENLDRDKRPDVVLVEDVSRAKRSGTKLTGASGLDSRPVYSRFFPVRRDDDQRVESHLWGAGDLQPDRVRDLVLLQWLRRDFEGGGGEWWLAKESLISGRTGVRLGTTWDLSPLVASVDGRGDDLFHWGSVPPSGFAVVDGHTRAVRLRVSLDIPLTLPTDSDFLMPFPARIDRDRCVDFVGTLQNSRSTFAVAIDGGSGRLLWAKRQQGLDVGGPVTQPRRLDRNRAC